MARITIGATALKEPSSFSISYDDIVKYRTTLAGTETADITRIGKRTIRFGYAYLTKAELKTIVDLLTPTALSFYKSVTFVDDIAVANTTISARVNERQLQLYMENATATIYENINFELVER